MNTQIQKTIPNKDILSLDGSNYQLTVRDLQNPITVTELVSTVCGLSGKRKIDFRELHIVLSTISTEQDIAEQLSNAIISADTKTAVSLWNSFGASLKYSIIVYDDGVLNTDIVRKLDIDGKIIRTAFLSKGSIAPPEKTPYAYINGDTSAEAAANFVNLLESIRKIKPEGPLLIREFFDEIDIRILYLFAVNEAEQFERDDNAGGAYLQLAVEMEDSIPCEVRLLSWLQQHVPETFSELRGELLNPVWFENRTMFWKGWIRQNRQEVDPDYYERRRGSNYVSKHTTGDLNDPLDDLINLTERSLDND